MEWESFGFSQTLSRIGELEPSRAQQSRKSSSGVRGLTQTKGIGEWEAFRQALFAKCGPSRFLSKRCRGFIADVTMRVPVAAQVVEPMVVDTDAFLAAAFSHDTARGPASRRCSSLRSEHVVTRMRPRLVRMESGFWPSPIAA